MEKLLSRSFEMCKSFDIALSSARTQGTPRALVASSLGSLRIEHGHALRVLIACKASSSALALFRCQFEVVTRAAWTWFAASDDWLSEFTKPVEGMAEPARSPSMDEMLKALEAGAAPRKLSGELGRLKSSVWKPLHSYVHGGVRPVAENLTGYAPDFLHKTVMNSNGLTAMAAMVLAGLMTDETRLMEMVRIQYQYIDCLPQPA